MIVMLCPVELWNSCSRRRLPILPVWPGRWSPRRRGPPARQRFPGQTAGRTSWSASAPDRLESDRRPHPGTSRRSPPKRRATAGIQCESISGIDAVSAHWWLWRYSWCWMMMVFNYLNYMKQHSFYQYIYCIIFVKFTVTNLRLRCRVNCFNFRLLLVNSGQRLPF